jgi:hypothetical protein
MYMPKRLRPVAPDERAEKRRKLTVTEAAKDGSHREMLVAIRARIAQTVEATDCNPVALAALSRQLVLISKELEVIDARVDDPVGEAARVPDEPWNEGML